MERSTDHFASFDSLKGRTQVVPAFLKELDVALEGLAVQSLALSR